MIIEDLWVMRRFSFLILILSFITIIVNAQKNIDSTSMVLKVYQLGEIIISESAINQTVFKKDMQKLNAGNVASSISMLPSVTLVNSGARNETTVFLRGFDLRSVPVFADGIPVYVPYDGYVDLGRFTNSDLSKIEVSKGYSSILYGANTIGGAINMISSKPLKKLEFELTAGAFSGKAYNTNLSVGSNLGKVYFQGSFSRISREYYSLSKDFDTCINETDYIRDNSYRLDNKVSVKVGFTPNENDEYSINYIYQHGEKGNPVYLGTDENIRIRYWQWPRWDKQSIYFISKTRLGKLSYLKTRVFYDKFINVLKSYDDDTYLTQMRPYAFTSNYNDYSYGASFETGTEYLKNNLFKIAGHYKYDMHRENNDGEPVRHFADNTLSIGIEDVFTPFSKLKIIPGISYNIRNSVIAEDYDSNNDAISNYPANSNSATNMQVATYYQFNDKINLSITGAYKTRFATMKDRYSYRLGIAIPNPDLIAETAMNYEISSKIRFADKISIQPAIFYSHINNTIQMVDNVLPGISQMQNTGESEFYGADISVNIEIYKNLILNANYSYIERQNISNPEILFTDVPKHSVFAYVNYSPVKSVELTFSSVYNSDRYSNSEGLLSQEFAVFNTNLSYEFAKYFKVETGIKNILDKNYTLMEGYPEEGRNYYFSLTYTLKK